MPVWSEALERAILRHIARSGSPVFTRQAFFAAEDAALREETRTIGRTPWQTATREFQRFRDAGLMQFLSPGTYRWLGPMPTPASVSPSNVVLVLAPAADRATRPEEGVDLRTDWLPIARRSVGEWALYQTADGSSAVARVLDVVSEGERRARFVARMEPGSYVVFGRVVPLEVDGRAIEPALAGPAGRIDDERAVQPVRAISRETFARIVDLGLVNEDDLLPRDAEEDAAPSFVREERSLWEGPVDRTTMLVERTVRDRQFRKRVLDAYGMRCALTGMHLINGGGRAETQAAHIKSVKAGGPDSVNNGIALSGTVHWMFDRGLISLSDAGDILLSRAINDRESVERLINRDGKAYFPSDADDRPYREYLHWHRTECFHH